MIWPAILSSFLGQWMCSLGHLHFDVRGVVVKRWYEGVRLPKMANQIHGWKPRTGAWSGSEYNSKVRFVGSDGITQNICSSSGTSTVEFVEHPKQYHHGKKRRLVSNMRLWFGLPPPNVDASFLHGMLSF
jgi:hypothetical protein